MNSTSLSARFKDLLLGIEPILILYVLLALGITAFAMYRLALRRNLVWRSIVSELEETSLLRQVSRVRWLISAPLLASFLAAATLTGLRVSRNHPLPPEDACYSGMTMAQIERLSPDDLQNIVCGPNHRRAESGSFLPTPSETVPVQPRFVRSGFPDGVSVELAGVSELVSADSGKPARWNDSHITWRSWTPDGQSLPKPLLTSYDFPLLYEGEEGRRVVYCLRVHAVPEDTRLVPDDNLAWDERTIPTDIETSLAPHQLWRDGGFHVLYTYVPANQKKGIAGLTIDAGVWQPIADIKVPAYSASGPQITASRTIRLPGKRTAYVAAEYHSHVIAVLTGFETPPAVRIVADEPNGIHWIKEASDFDIDFAKKGEIEFCSHHILPTDALNVRLEVRQRYHVTWENVALLPSRQ